MWEILGSWINLCEQQNARDNIRDERNVWLEDFCQGTSRVKSHVNQIAWLNITSQLSSKDKQHVMREILNKFAENYGKFGIAWKMKRDENCSGEFSFQLSNAHFPKASGFPSIRLINNRKFIWILFKFHWENRQFF